jgi:hypothetical protein
MTKQELQTNITALIESGQLKASPTTIKAGHEQETGKVTEIEIPGYLIHEKPSAEIAAVLLQAVEHFAIVDGFTGRPTIQ